MRHGTRHSLKVLPKYYKSQFDSCRPVEVTTLDFSPSGEPLFLVCSDFKDCIACINVLYFLNVLSNKIFLLLLVLT